MPAPTSDRSRPAPDRADSWVRLGLLVYAVAAFTFYCFWKWSLAERNGDPAIFENMLWNAAHGHGLRTSLEGGQHHLAIHFSPILYLLVPPYALFPSLHVAHALVAIGTAVAGYLLYRRFRPSLGATAAAMGVAAFLLHPTIAVQNFMEFHELALAPAFGVGLLLAHEARRTRWVAVAGLGLVSIREDTPILLATLGLFALLFDGPRRRLGLLELGIAALGIALYLVVGVMALGEGEVAGVFGGTYSTWGTSPGEAMRYVLTHPLAVVKHLLSPSVLSYLAQLTAPLLGPLAFVSPWGWAALPTLALNLMADPGARALQVRMHYSILPACVLAFGALHGIERLLARPADGHLAWLRRPEGWTGAMLAVALLAAPLWLGKAMERIHPWRHEVRTVLAQIPDTAAVTAPMYLVNELARRRDVGFARTDRIDRREYMLVEDASRKYYAGQTIDTFYTAALGESLAHEGYEPVLVPAGWHLWRRRPAR